MITLLGTTEEPEKLRITNSEETYESYGNTFVITLVMHYEAVDDCIDGVKMVCSARGEAAMTFRSSREISILDGKYCINVFSETIIFYRIQEIIAHFVSITLLLMLLVI